MGLLLDDKSVIHKPKPMPGRVEVVQRASLSKYNMYKFDYYGAYWGSQSCSFNLFLEFILKREVCIMQTEP